MRFLPPALLAGALIAIPVTPATAQAAPTHYPLALVSTAPDRLELFRRSAAGTLQLQIFVTRTGWTAPRDLGGRLTSGPGVTSRGPGSLLAFVRGSDGALWYKEYADGSGWSGWVGLGGRASIDAPAPVARPEGVDVFVRGVDNQVWYRSQRNGAWSGWRTLGGRLASGVAGVRTNSTTNVFARMTDATIWQRRFDGMTWTDWAQVDRRQVTSTPGVSTPGNGQIDLYVRGVGNTLQHRRLGAGTTPAWEDLGGALVTPPTAVTWAPGHQDVMYMSVDSTPTHLTYDNGWQSPKQAGVNVDYLEELAPGVTFQSRFDPRGPWAIQVVTLDLSAGASLDVALAQDQLPGLEATSSMARRHSALAAVNGDFALSGGRPVHAYAEDGWLIQTDQVRGRNFALAADESTAFADFPAYAISATVAKTAERLPVTRVNSGTVPDQVVAFTPAGAALTPADTALCSARLRRAAPRLEADGSVVTATTVDAAACNGAPLSALDGTVLATPSGGARDLSLRSLVAGDAVSYRWSLGFAGVLDSIGGNPVLVKDGAIVDADVDGSGSFFLRHPRTGVGYVPGVNGGKGKVVLVTVDGRQAGRSAGMTLREFATYFVSLGATKVLNLDGGGSTTMTVQGNVTNIASDGFERGVSSALLVLPGVDPGEQPSQQPSRQQPRMYSGPRAVSAESWRDIAADPGSTGGLLYGR